MKYKIGQFLITISFDVVSDNLDEDILCDDNGDWIISADRDWQIASGQRALEQDLQEGIQLSYGDDILDIQEGANISRYKNANFTNETVIELKQAITTWLESDDRINPDTLEVTIERYNQ